MSSIPGGFSALREVVADFHLELEEEEVKNVQSPYLARQLSVF